jgi:hypothetical protein
MNSPDSLKRDNSLTQLKAGFAVCSKSDSCFFFSFCSGHVLREQCGDTDGASDLLTGDPSVFSAVLFQRALWKTWRLVPEK